MEANKRAVSTRTIKSGLKADKYTTFFNQEIVANIADRKYYPFGKGKIVIKFPDSLKID